MCHRVGVAVKVKTFRVRLMEVYKIVQPYIPARDKNVKGRKKSLSCLRIYQGKSHFFSAKHQYYGKIKRSTEGRAGTHHTAHTGHAGAQGYLAGTGMDSGDTCVFKCSRGAQAAQSTSTACAKRMMALGGTPADLSMLSSKPAGSAIDVNEAQP